MRAEANSQRSSQGTKPCDWTNARWSPLPSHLAGHYAQIPGTGVTVREVLRSEYLAVASSGRKQPEWGFKGQAQAVWDHNVSASDIKTIREGTRRALLVRVLPNRVAVIQH